MYAHVTKALLLASTLLTTAVFAAPTHAAAEVTLLHASYDATRELFQDINAAFIPQWEQKSGDKLIINQSHAGSGEQTRAVLDGLQADIVSLALGYDIDVLANHGLVRNEWHQALPNGASPFYSTIVFVVRGGNPKHIHDWNDLVRSDVSLITANPKTSGGARWNYLAAWGYAKRLNGGDDAKARAFVQALYKNVKVLDAGSRGATTSFASRGLGDVLITWENEAHLVLKEFGDKQFSIVTPSQSIKAEPVVAVVDQVVDRRNTRPQAEAYLNFLYTDKAQEIAADHFLRPISPAVQKQTAARFSPIELFKIEDVFGSWEQAQRTHFADGGIFDQIYSPNS